jgi:hypothetical protein
MSDASIGGRGAGPAGGRGRSGSGAGRLARHLRPPDLGHARTIARTELRRRGRSLADSPQAIVLLFGALFGLLAAVAAGFGAFVLAGTAGGGSGAVPRRIVRVVAAGAFGLPALLVAFRIVAGKGEVDGGDGLLTTVPHRDVLAGLIAVEAAGGLAYVSPVVLAVAAGLALGAGSPVPLVVGLGLGLLVLAAAVVVGFAAGLGLRAVVARVPAIARHRTAVGAAVFVVYAGLLVTDRIGSTLGPVLDALAATPVGWTGDVVLLVIGAGGDPLPALAGVATLLAAVPAGFVVAAALAERAWFADPVPGGDAGGAAGEAGRDATADAPDEPAGKGTDTATEPTIARPLGPLDRPTSAVARKAWLRARRSPIKLVYVLYPLFGLVGVVSNGLSLGGEGALLPAFVPVLAATYGAWASGAAFALNPFGDEGAALAATLTTPLSGRRFVRGTLVAATAVGVPLTAVLTVATGLASPLDPVAVAGLTVVGAGFAGGAVAIAAGVGSAFPRFETARVIRSREAVVPSLVAFAVFSIALGCCAVPLVAALPGVASAVAGGIGVVGPVAVQAIGGAGALALVAGVGVAGYRYAVSTYDGYRIE